MILPIHPFPARMAPELALSNLKILRKHSVVLDPMMGSGTVLRHACELGHTAIGFDMDPLAVLMSRVWTRPVEDVAIQRIYNKVLNQALALDPADVNLPWLDGDISTTTFIRYWFGASQIRDLRCLAFSIHQLKLEALTESSQSAIDVLRIALSRIIVTKEQSASLARDTSHSRPHRVTLNSNYSVFSGFERSLNMVRKRLIEAPPKIGATVSVGDARSINLSNHSVDIVLTSPPYLNAIDYMRGHRLSLVWLGHSLTELRAIRSTSIGAERGPDKNINAMSLLKTSMDNLDALPPRYALMIDRYASDIFGMMAEVARVMKPSAKAILVVGNSRLKGVFIHNADVVVKAAELLGLQLTQRYERELPNQNRYLPALVHGALGKRMRVETILTFGLRN